MIVVVVFPTPPLPCATALVSDWPRPGTLVGLRSAVRSAAVNATKGIANNLGIPASRYSETSTNVFGRQTPAIRTRQAVAVGT
jgi:hypothetical protein